MLQNIAQGYTLQRVLMFLGLKKREKHLLAQARELYSSIVAGARQVALYRDWAMRDDRDGRMEMISLHLFLVLERIRLEPCENVNDDPALIGQFLAEVAVADLENNLREMGVGDLAVGKRVQKYTKRQYARYALYREWFSGDGGNKDACVLDLIEYVYADDKGVTPIKAKQGAEHLHDYIAKNMTYLAEQPIADICKAPKFLDVQSFQQ